MDLVALEHVAWYFQDGAFVFDLGADEYTVTEGNTVYHLLPRYANEGAESVVNKLRRIMERELEEKEWKGCNISIGALQ